MLDGAENSTSVVDFDHLQHIALRPSRSTQKTITARTRHIISLLFETLV